eukprot:4874595-Pyramimonas_sp.AAC.1
MPRTTWHADARVVLPSSDAPTLPDEAGFARSQQGCPRRPKYNRRAASKRVLSNLELCRLDRKRRNLRQESNRFGSVTCA